MKKLLLLMALGILSMYGMQRSVTLFSLSDASEEDASVALMGLRADLVSLYDVNWKMKQLKESQSKQERAESMRQLEQDKQKIQSSIDQRYIQLRVTNGITAEGLDSLNRKALQESFLRRTW